MQAIEMQVLRLNTGNLRKTYIINMTAFNKHSFNSWFIFNQLQINNLLYFSRSSLKATLTKLFKPCQSYQTWEASVRQGQRTLCYKMCNFILQLIYVSIWTRCCKTSQSNVESCVWQANEFCPDQTMTLTRQFKNSLSRKLEQHRPMYYRPIVATGRLMCTRPHRLCIHWLYVRDFKRHIYIVYMCHT